MAGHDLTALEHILHHISYRKYGRMPVLHVHPLCRSAEIEIFYVVPDRFSPTMLGNPAEGKNASRSFLGDI